MRRTLKMMDDWFFTDLSQKKNHIALPHTWNGKDGQDGGNDYARGTCFYEKEFDMPSFDKEKEVVYLQFHGVNASAKVFLNQQEICNHDGGYATFRVEVTKLLTAKNALKVEVDNSVNERVYPQKADFTFYGGIYRDVELLIVPKLHFDLEYYGSNGLRVSADVKEAAGESKTGIVTVSSFLDSHTYEVLCATESAHVQIEILDAEGKVVVQKQVSVRDSGLGTKLLIEDVNLWHGVKSPYLYQVRVSLMRGDEKLDEVLTNIGIRTFQFDADKGFFLNGESYPLHGVSRHQDWKNIGNAISYEQMEQDMELIREIGANTIRLAHYQHDQHFYDLCDKYGMVVWAEIPYISAHMPDGRENTFSQMKELIVQNYNHPSIVTWGVSNEITISPKHKKDMLDNHHALQKLCKEMDPTRPTTLACYAMCSPFHPVTKITDIVAWNLYLGWYVPGLFLNDWFMKFYHFMYPSRCLGYSEYGAEGMPNLHSGRPRRGDHTEEYQAKYHEYMLGCFERHPFMWGTYVWNMFDFAADARDQGGEPGMNHKGLVTFDRKIKKDSFYLYKAWWSDAPFVHISGKRYEYRTEQVTTVTVYSNQDEVTLYHNGNLLETQKGKHVFKFKVTLADKNVFEVKAGEYLDTAVIYKTDTPKAEYKVKKGKSQNWV